MYEIFEKLLKARNVKTVDVCKATGLRQSMFSDWKKGRAKPKADKLQLIADYFGVPLDFLISGNDTNKSARRTEYYLDEETAKAAQELFDDPDTRILFDAARNASPEAIRLATEMLKAFKKTNPDG